MKGLVLCAGFGTRLRPLTYTGAKHLIPVANRPILFYAIEYLVQAGVREIGLIVGGATRSQVEEAVGTGAQFGARVTFLHQERPLGLAHAVAIARDFIAGDRFIVYLGDNIIHGGIADFVEAFPANASAQLLLAKVPDPRRFGVADVQGERVVRLVEKPQTMELDMAIVGVYAFTQEVFDAVERISPSARGELEITDAIQCLVDDGKFVRAHGVRSWWADTGRPEDVLDVNRMLLQEIGRDIQGDVGPYSKMVGNVVVGRGTVVRNSVVRGPVIIGAECLIEDCYIGPYTSIADNCELRNTEIEFSILMPNCTVVDMPVRVDASLVGNQVTLARNEGPARTMQFVLGDDSRIAI